MKTLTHEAFEEILDNSVATPATKEEYLKISEPMTDRERAEYFLNGGEGENNASGN